MNFFRVSHAIGFIHRFALRCGPAIAAGLLLVAGSAMAASITVPNGNFSNSANNGSIGGGLIGGSGSAAIGSGPWHGTYAGVLGLLAPPQLTITTGYATIGGLAGVNVLGIVSNNGYFSQTLGDTYAANSVYVLGADIDAGSPLDAGVLNDSNAGLALTDGATTILASTANSSNVSLVLLSGTRYHLTLQYTTGAIAGGNIGLQLFAMPQNLVTANLLTSVSFSNITLSQSAVNPVAAAVGSASGTPQGATVNTPFAAPLVVQVVDAQGDPVPGVTVTFLAPASGASAVLSATTAVTDINGLAQITASANATAGAYTVTASVGGVATPASFDLTNIAGSVSAVAASTGTPQSATVNTAFATSLGVIVTDADSNPVAGITVTFSTPNSQASAIFPNGATVSTDASGVAQIQAVANTVAGSYVVTASVNGASSTASFNLTNTAGPATLGVPITGTPQSAAVSTQFSVPLGIKVTDAYGNGISGISVTFDAPASGASATFPPDGGSTIVVTGADGSANVQALANATPGAYQVTASFSGQNGQTVFNLTNTALPPPMGAATSGGGQSANVNAAFLCLLQLKVTSDGSTPMSGVSIDFVAPDSGPSAMLSNGIVSGTQITTITDTNGLTSVTATANAIPGAFTVAAGVTGSNSALASYVLTNLNANDRIFASGFEATPALCPGG